MLEFVINLGTGILGLLIYIGWNTRRYIMDGTFNIKTGWDQNWKRGTWVIVMIFLLAIVYMILPEAFNQMSGLDGFSVPETVEKGTFFGISIGLSKYIKLLVKKNRLPE